MPTVPINFLGNARSGVTAAKEMQGALRGVSQQIKTTNVDSKTAAREQVESSVRRQEALKREIATYRQVANEYKRGSREQAAAAELVERKQRELNSVIGSSHKNIVAYTRGVTTAHGEMGKMTRGAVAGSGAFRSMGRSIAFASAAFLGTAGLVNVLRSSVTEASNLHEQMDKTARVFTGKAGRDIIRWSKDAAVSFGESQEAALRFASTFGAFLRPMGVSVNKAAEMSKRLTQLGGDLAAFYNTDVESALHAIQSGLVGQVRPLRQYGVALSQARIEAEALTSGIVKAKVDMDAVQRQTERIALAQEKANDAARKYGEGSRQQRAAALQVADAEAKLTKILAGHVPQLSADEKAFASYRIILKDTSLAHNNFRDTSKGLAQQQKILHAQIQDLEAELGKALMPTILRVTQAITGWLSKSENQHKVTKALHDVVATLKEIVQQTWPVVKQLAQWANNAAQAVGGWSNVLKIFLAYKMARIVGGWTASIGRFITGVANAGRAISGSGGLLGRLRSLTARTWMIRIGFALIGYEIVWKAVQALTGQAQLGRDFSDPLTGQDTPATGKMGIITRDRGGPDADARTRAHPTLTYTDPSGQQHRAIQTKSGAFYYLDDGKWKPVPSGAKELQTMKGGKKTYGTYIAPGKDRATNFMTDTRGGVFQPPPISGLGGHDPSQSFLHSGAEHDFLQATAGTTILAPEDGRLEFHGGHDPRTGVHPGNVGGWSFLFYGVSGTEYAATHLAKVNKNGFYKEGQPIAVVAHIAGLTEHLHWEQKGPGTHKPPKSPNPLGGGVNVGTNGMPDTGGGPGPPGPPSAAISRVERRRREEERRRGVAISGVGQRVADALAGNIPAAINAGLANLGDVGRSIGNVGKKVAEAFAAPWRAQFTKLVQSLRPAIDTFMDLALRVFDAKTDEMVRKARVKVKDLTREGGMFEIGVGEETPTEKLLRERQEARERQDRSDRLAEAIASGDPKAIADAQYDIETADLEAKAKKEREDADAALAKEQTRIEAERAVQRGKLVSQVGDIQARVGLPKEKGGITAEQATKQITALLEKAGITGKAAADLLGEAWGVEYVRQLNTVYRILWKITNLFLAMAGKPPIKFEAEPVPGEPSTKPPPKPPPAGPPQAQYNPPGSGGQATGFQSGGTSRDPRDDWTPGGKGWRKGAPETAIPRTGSSPARGFAMEALASLYRRRHGPWPEWSSYEGQAIEAAKAERARLEETYEGNIHFADAWMQAISSPRNGRRDRFNTPWPDDLTSLVEQSINGVSPDLVRQTWGQIWTEVQGDLRYQLPAELAQTYAEVQAGLEEAPWPKAQRGLLIGQRVPGTDLGRDSVPALLRPGEMVLNNAQKLRLASLLGHRGHGANDFMSARLGVPKFAGGGTSAGGVDRVMSPRSSAGFRSMGGTAVYVIQNNNGTYLSESRETQRHLVEMLQPHIGKIATVYARGLRY